MVPNRVGPGRHAGGGCRARQTARSLSRGGASVDNAAMMKTLHRWLVPIPVALALCAPASAADYEAGQIWSVKGRAQDPDPQVLILKVEPGTPVGDVIFVAAGGLKLCLPKGKCGIMFSPLAMSKEALDRSVKELVTRVGAVSDEERARFQLEKGYQFWKDGIAKGAPVTITVPLAEALDQMEGGAKIQVK